MTQSSQHFLSSNSLPHESLSSKFSSQSWYEYIESGFWEQYGDDYAQGYYLVDGGPWKILSIISLYLLFVKVIGPAYMKNRPPYDLKNVLYYYNLIHIVGNGLGAITTLYITRFTYDCWKSTRTGDPNNPYHTLLLYLSLFYFCAKFLDLFDTVFFILRKKDKQVSFLHVVHHSVMPFCTYIALRFAPIGRTSIIGIVNSCVHTVMYTYYFLSSMPSMQKHLWWKKYITQMQIVQFVIFLSHSLQGIFFIDYNDFPLGVSILELLNALFFLKSFVDFFKDTYKSSPATNSETKHPHSSPPLSSTTLSTTSSTTSFETSSYTSNTLRQRLGRSEEEEEEEEERESRGL